MICENIPEDIVQLIPVLTYKVFSFELLTIHQSKDIELFFILVSARPPQDVDVPAVLDFRIPCFRPKTSNFYPQASSMNTKPVDKN